MSSQVVEYPAIWIAGASCSGCSVSLLNSVSPTIANLLVDTVLPGKHVNLRFHATVMAGQGEPAVEVMLDTAKEKAGGYLLLVEGSVLRVGDNDLLNTGSRTAQYVECGQGHAVAAQNVTVTAEGLSVTRIVWQEVAQAASEPHP